MEVNIRCTACSRAGPDHVETAWGGAGVSCLTDGSWTCTMRMVVAPGSRRCQARWWVSLSSVIPLDVNFPTEGSVTHGPKGRALTFDRFPLWRNATVPV